MKILPLSQYLLLVKTTKKAGMVCDGYCIVVGQSYVGEIIYDHWKFGHNHDAKLKFVATSGGVNF